MDNIEETKYEISTLAPFYMYLDVGYTGIRAANAYSSVCTKYSAIS